MCSCLIMSKLFFLFRIRGKLITVSIKLWLYTLNFFFKKIIFMLIFTKLAGPPLVLGQSHILLLNLSSRWVLSRLDLWVHSWCTNERALTWKHGKHRSECYFQPHSANPNHSPFNTCLHILKKKHRVNVTGFHYYPNYRKQLLTKCWRKKQKAREVSNELRVYSSFIPQRLINSSDSETWKGSGKEVMLKQTVCRWSFKPFLFFCKHPLAV